MHIHKYVCVACLTAALPLQRLVLEASSAAAPCRHSVVAGPARGSQEGPSPSHSPAPADADPPTLLHPPSLSSGFKDFHTRLEYFFAWLIPLLNVLLGLVTFVSSSSASHPNKG